MNAESFKILPSVTVSPTVEDVLLLILFTVSRYFLRKQGNKEQKIKQDKCQNFIGSSRPIKTSKNLNSKTNFNKNTSKTVYVTSSHSYQITIKELMIMLIRLSTNKIALKFT